MLSSSRFYALSTVVAHHRCTLCRCETLLAAVREEGEESQVIVTATLAGTALLSSFPNYEGPPNEHTMDAEALFRRLGNEVGGADTARLQHLSTSMFLVDQAVIPSCISFVYGSLWSSLAMYFL